MTRYKTIADNPRMGLNNKLCKDPVAYCESKHVFLSATDVEFKKCKCKPTVDPIGVVRCNWLHILEGGKDG